MLISKARHNIVVLGSRVSIYFTENRYLTSLNVANGDEGSAGWAQCAQVRAVRNGPGHKALHSWMAGACPDGSGGVGVFPLRGGSQFVPPMAFSGGNLVPPV